MRSGGLIDPDKAAELLAASDAAIFSERLLNVAHSVAGIDELFAFRVEEGKAPLTLASSSGLGDAGERARAYAQRFHHHDPVHARRRSTPPGSGFHLRVPTEAIALGDYRRLCFERPRFSEKVCFGWRKSDHAVVVSFYQRHEALERDLAPLGALAQIALTGLTRLSGRVDGSLRFIEELERRLATAHGTLTAREREVCARTLAGRTAREIATELGIGAGTVLTYRQRAYLKLGLSRASDLLPAVMN